MNIASFIVVFVIAWWLIFFMLLPVGVQREDNPEVGHDIGAPKKPMLVRKALICTVLAALVLVGYWYLADVVGVTLIDRGNLS